MIDLARAELGGGRLVDRVGRDDFAVPVDPARERVNLHLEDIADDRETATHIAVKRTIADGHLALVAGGQKQGAEFIGERHHQHSADAGLDIFLGHVAGASGEDRTERGFGRGNGIGDGNRLEADAKVGRKDAGVVAGMLGRD